MPELAVTAIGPDRPGIVAAVTAVLAEGGDNVEDSAMTILGGQFALVLLVASSRDAAALSADLEAATGGFGLALTVAAVHEAAAGRGVPTHVLSVYGSDRPGLLAAVTRTLADADANVTDLTTRLIGDDEQPVYAMVVELTTSDEGAVAAAVAATCDDLGVDHTLRALDTETY